ncbi:MAG: pentapeptide repeat-containing protein [Phycisphaeraceae bacterium]|nr:pentapeptide repeat-containing protein [Phycisphaeraceae bacterium]
MDTPPTPPTPPVPPTRPFSAGLPDGPLERPSDYPDYDGPLVCPFYGPDHPARRDEESKEAFNEAVARLAFGDLWLDSIINAQNPDGSLEDFRGDWWALAMLHVALYWAKLDEHSDTNPERLETWSSLVGSLSIIYVPIHLENANLAGTRLQFCNFELVHMEQAWLHGTHLEHAYFQHAHLRRTRFGKAYLNHADLRYANMQGSTLHRANLEYADLRKARLNSASLVRSNLAHANLHDADLDHAKVRNAHGVRFNDTKVERLDIEGNAPDPWSTLRRTYTGPMFFVHLLLLVAFVLPYAAKVLTLTMTARGYDALRASLEAGDGAPPGGEVVRAWLDNFDATHTQTHALWVLLGGTHAWWPLMVGTAVVILLYNILRGHLTLTVGVLRDQADRVHRTPTLEEYYGACHPLAGKDAGWHRVTAVWWRRCKQWRNSERRWKNRGTLNPLPVIGPWHLHRFASWLFWISIASVALHAGWWLWDTTVPVPVPR